MFVNALLATGGFLSALLLVVALAALLIIAVRMLYALYGFARWKLKRGGCLVRMRADTRGCVLHEHHIGPHMSPVLYRDNGEAMVLRFAGTDTLYVTFSQPAPRWLLRRWNMRASLNAPPPPITYEDTL